jgi:hypothetical protein
MSYIFLFIVFLCIILAVREKIKSKKYKASSAGLPEEIKGSPISHALGEMVAIAGGIYVSLLLLTTFLDLNLPEKVNISTLEVDTIALLALFLTLGQPFILKVAKKLKLGWFK